MAAGLPRLSGNEIAEACLVKTDTGEIGVTFTVGAGPGRLAGESIGIMTEKTNARHISELGQWFKYGGVGFGVDAGRDSLVDFGIPRSADSWRL